MTILVTLRVFARNRLRDSPPSKFFFFFVVQQQQPNKVRIMTELLIPLMLCVLILSMTADSERQILGNFSMTIFFRDSPRRKFFFSLDIIVLQQQLNKHKK